MTKPQNLFSDFRVRNTSEPTAESVGEQEGELWIVAGLGNPGSRFEATRHNLGFMVVDRLAAKYQAELNDRKFEAVLGKIAVDQKHNVLLMKPLTYYNQTGRSVAAVRGYFKVPLNHLITIHDDMDLSPGRLQVRVGGHYAGNRGVRSLIEAIGSDQFVRLRVGIGRPPEGEDPVDFVLKRMSQEELAGWSEVIDRACKAVETIILQGPQKAMNEFNRRN